MAPKVIAAALSLSSMLAAIPMNPVQAQEYQGCFMVDGSGRAISLSSMCPQVVPFEAPKPESETEAETNSASTSQSVADVDVESVARIYAGRFCESRFDGYVGDAARSRAYDYQQTLLGDVSALDVPGLIDREAELIKEMCPQFVFTPRTPNSK